MKLTPEERDARRKERSRRSFSDNAYEHYDPVREGFGSPVDWAAAAEAMAAGHGTSRRDAWTNTEDMRHAHDLRLLGLDTVPADLAGLKTAFRRAAFRAHPDHGGTDAAFRDVFAAYQRLLSAY